MEKKILFSSVKPKMKRIYFIIIVLFLYARLFFNKWFKGRFDNMHSIGIGREGDIECCRHILE